jgi:hypothetical protein
MIMIDYIININYILAYKRYEKIKRFSPEDSCLVLTDLEVGNFLILSMYFTAGLLHKFDLLGNKIVLYIWLGILFAIILWAHVKIDKKIQQASIRKTVKKLAEKDKLRYSRLAVLYFVLSLLLWILAFTWRVILYGSAAMVTVTPK